MNRKKIMTGLAIFAICAVATANADTWTDPATGIEWQYIDNGDGTAAVGSGSPDWAVVPASTAGALTIPAALDGRSVTSVAEYAFTGCDALTSVTLPSGVTNIENYAFHSCAALASVRLPSGVKRIGMRTFQGCPALTSVDLPEGLVSIGAAAFEMCDSLRSVTFPASLERIDANAFSACEALTAIEIPARVTKIGEKAFYFCSALSSVTFFGDAPEVGEGAFEYLAENATVSVLEGTQGWPSVGEEWNAMTVMRPGYSSETFPAALAVSPGATLTVAAAPGKALTADRAAAWAARVTVVPRETAQEARYFKVTADVNAAGAAVLRTALDLEAMEFGVTSNELLGQMVSAADASDVTVRLTSAKKGFWYGVKAATTPGTLSSAAETVVQADESGVTLTVPRPLGDAAFFTVTVRAAY